MRAAHLLLIERYGERSWWSPALSDELVALDTWDELRRRLSNGSPSAVRAATTIIRPRLSAGLVRSLRRRAKIRRRTAAHCSALTRSGSRPGQWTIEVEEPSAATRWRSRARNLRDLSIFVPDRRRVAYIGWLGHSNAGDTAVFDAYRHAFSSLAVRPVTPDGGFVRRATSLPLPIHFRALMLGGGTLIGTEPSRRALELLHRADPDVPLIMFGTGVEDPTWEAPYAGELAAELRRWPALLREFSGGIAVRGPRSAALLAEVGIEAEVVGDPALLLGDRLPRPARVGEPVLAVNVGLARHIYGGKPARVLDRIAAAAAIAIQQGWAVHVLPVWPPDVEYSQALADRLGPRARMFADTIDVGQLLGRLAAADAIIGMKLHSVVLAAAVGTPGLMVAYHPKCIDFHESIGRAAATLRTDELDDDRLLRATERLLADHAPAAVEVSRAVAVMRLRLQARALSITELIAANNKG
jgi:polysaccharide pyruvyl transferase WcaK-like protein